jgi:ABC-type siderophore export system fused ATPase/permease subunit
MIVSMHPLAWNVDRWKQTLKDYRIDGKPVLDLTHDEDRDYFDKIDGIMEARDQERGALIESCPDILTRTAGEEVVTDDNMGTEWELSSHSKK